MREARLTADLPEHLARLYVYKTGKFETPLDSTGIADIDALFELAIHTYPGELPSFDDAERNRHHVYWSESWWQDFANQHRSADRRTIQTFRSSTPQVAYVPVQLHSWIEEVMIPPPAPPLPVMRRRNAAWEVASILLQSVTELDQARIDYDRKKHNVRRMIGYIAGLSPRSTYTEEPYVDVVDSEYWLSELNSRIDSWRVTASIYQQLPPEQQLVSVNRLSDVRNFKRRIRSSAIVPVVPDIVRAA